MDLRDQVVLITGGAEGIGAACAREMSDWGAKLSIVDLKEPPDGLLKSGDLFSPGDVADPHVRYAAVERTLDRFGTIGVLINNAGIGLYTGSLNTSLEQGRRLFEVNLFAALAMCQLVSPVMASNRKGVIVNIGSIGGEVALPWAAMYCASKFALHSLSDSLRRELKDCGIRVVTVVPGVVRTGFRSHVLGGCPPTRVLGIRGRQPMLLARAIRKKLVGNGSRIFQPWYGTIFALVDRIAPQLIDAYMSFMWSPERLVAVYPGNGNRPEHTSYEMPESAQARLPETFGERTSGGSQKAQHMRTRTQTPARRGG